MGCCDEGYKEELHPKLAWSQPVLGNRGFKGVETWRMNIGDVTGCSSAAITVFLAPILPFSGQPSQHRGTLVPQKREMAE